MKNCPLCGHDAYVSLFDGKFKVVLCRTCSLVFIPNDSRDLKKFYSEEYSYQETKSDFIDDTKFNNRIFNWIIKSIDASKEIDLLEVGSHSGFLLKRFKAIKHIKVHGIEPSRS